VGKVADRVGDALARWDILAVLLVGHALAATGVDVHHCDVVCAEQRPAGTLYSSSHVVGLSFAHSESAILRSASDLLSRTDARLGELAKVYDRIQIAILVCEASYNALIR
jgi:hypothetical protein